MRPIDYCNPAGAAAAPRDMRAILRRALRRGAVICVFSAAVYAGAYVWARRAGYLVHRAGYLVLPDASDVRFSHRVDVGDCPYDADPNAAGNGALAHAWEKRAAGVRSAFAPVRGIESAYWQIRQPAPRALFDAALYFAALNGDVPAVDRLIAKGANVDARSLRNSDETPLHAAVDKGHVEVVRRLLRAGADPELRNRQGDRPVDFLRGARYDDDECKLLLIAAAAARRIETQERDRARP